MIFKVNNSNLTDGLLALVKKDVKFTYSSNSAIYGSSLDVMIGAQTQSDSCVGSHTVPPTWLEISFGNRYIIPSYYSMQGRISSQYNGDYLQSWELEGKTRNRKWIKLDNQENNPFSFGSFKTFPIGSNVPIKSLRINMTEADNAGGWWICLGHFDVYGHLMSANEYLKTCNMNHHHHYFSFYFTIALLTYV